MLYSVDMNKDGSEDKGKIYISILLEHQSTSDPLMPFRMQKYMLRICDAHLTAHPNSKLPVIYPMILYTGKRPYSAPTSFFDMFCNPSLAKTYFTDPVQLINTREMTDQDLALDLKNCHYIQIVLRIMRNIHTNDILPSLLTYTRN